MGKEAVRKRNARVVLFVKVWQLLLDYFKKKKGGDNFECLWGCVGILVLVENIEYYKNLSGRFERKLDRITIRIFFGLIFWEKRIDN